MMFTLVGKKGQALTEDEVLALPKARRAAVEQAEQELRAEITRYIEKTQPLERAMNEALAALRRQVVKPLARARTAGDPQRAEEADQGRRQAQRLARRAGTGRVRQPGTVQRRRGRRKPAGSPEFCAGALPRQSGGRQRRPRRRAGDRRGQSAVPCAVRQHRVPVRKRCAGHGFFTHPCRQPVAGAWRLSDAAFARRAGRSAWCGSSCGAFCAAAGCRSRSRACHSRRLRRCRWCRRRSTSRSSWCWSARATSITSCRRRRRNSPATSAPRWISPTASSPAPTAVAPRRFSSPMPAASSACRIFRRRRWRACSRNRTARRATRRVKARFSAAPKRW